MAPKLSGPRKQVVSGWNTGQQQFTFLKNPPFGLSAFTSAKFVANYQKVRDNFAGNDDTGPLVKYELAASKLLRCAAGARLREWPQSEEGALPVGQMTETTDGAGSDNGEESDDDEGGNALPQLEPVAGEGMAVTLARVARFGRHPFPVASKQDIATQRFAGLGRATLGGVNGAPPSSVGANAKLWPVLTKQDNGVSTQASAFCDHAAVDLENLFDSMSRWATLSEERRTLGSHFGSIAGALALWVLGCELHPGFATSQLGKFLDQINKQYGRNQVVMLHASALAAGTLEIIRAVPNYASAALKTYQLGASATDVHEWFAPGYSIPGMAYKRGGAEETLRILQIIPDAIVVVQTRAATDPDHHFVIEWKTRHTPKDIEGPKLQGYWRQAVLQGVAYWSAHCSANPLFKPGGNSRSPVVSAALVTSKVHGDKGQHRARETYTVVIDTATAQKVLLSILLFSIQDTSTDSKTSRSTFFLDDGLPNEVPLIISRQTGIRYTDHTLALAHDLAMDIAHPTNTDYVPRKGQPAQWRAVSPLALGNTFVRQPLMWSQFGQCPWKTPFALAEPTRKMCRAKLRKLLESYDVSRNVFSAIG
jgi:hypothetical protein